MLARTCRGAAERRPRSHQFAPFRALLLTLTVKVMPAARTMASPGAAFLMN